MKNPVLMTKSFFAFFFVLLSHLHANNENPAVFSSLTIKISINVIVKYLIIKSLKFYGVMMMMRIILMSLKYVNEKILSDFVLSFTFFMSKTHSIIIFITKHVQKTFLQNFNKILIRL